jgi:hypothetical protein
MTVHAINPQSGVLSAVKQYPMGEMPIVRGTALAGGEPREIVDIGEPVEIENRPTQFPRPR